VRHYVVGVDTSTSERSPWLRQLPPTVVTEVRRRRSAILARAAGRVLDLDTPGALTLVEAAADDDGVADDERYDTIVCTCRLIEVPDLLRATTGLARLLAADGDLHLIEPVNTAGTVGLLTSSAGTLLPAVDGLHLARDVPAAVRATGLTVVDLDRSIPTLVWPLRRFIEAGPASSPPRSWRERHAGPRRRRRVVARCTFDQLLLDASRATGSRCCRPGR
jgi:hypothetical protein